MMLGKPIKREFNGLLKSMYYLGPPPPWDHMRGSLRIINVVTNFKADELYRSLTKEERHA